MAAATDHGTFGGWKMTSAIDTRDAPVLIALDVLPDADIEIGELIVVVDVHAANIVKDIRENIRNLVGGRMVHYEQLVQHAVNSALNDLKEAARQKSYDGIVGLKISHPSLVEGGVEVIVYGNGFRYRRES